jgi:hypothetical protein
MRNNYSLKNGDRGGTMTTNVLERVVIDTSHDK